MRTPPYGHLTITMRPKDKLKDSSDIDMRVSAEFPPYCQTTQRELYDTIATRMVNGHCGAHAPCMRADGTCSKGYPKELAEDTTLKEGSYPIYRRRDDDSNHVKMAFPWTTVTLRFTTRT